MACGRAGVGHFDLQFRGIEFELKHCHPNKGRHQQMKQNKRKQVQGEDDKTAIRQTADQVPTPRNGSTRNRKMTKTLKTQQNTPRQASPEQPKNMETKQKDQSEVITARNGRWIGQDQLTAGDIVLAVAEVGVVCREVHGC